MRGALHDRIVARLIAERRSRRLTQAQLAVRLGRSTSCVFRYEAGARYIDIAEFIAIARALDVDPLELLRQAEADG
ncbi:helix-turn-helix domain-containing protein [Bosea rubneri]|uniref:Helix-turn-helix transcriptional regulator n=1 Tax=Bosea rubneri TaxID=3075434 RepID=A0ABU3SE10_9HYPH|nr:helix-turn-helix transcriptional regulator [Bosea sp. ZW T0_25]MDU0343027.1 helix-turn-helix transcriptional regulator [Bosea sp. ZW T0_25]